MNYFDAENAREIFYTEIGLIQSAERMNITLPDLEQRLQTADEALEKVRRIFEIETDRMQDLLNAGRGVTRWPE